VEKNPASPNITSHAIVSIETGEDRYDCFKKLVLTLKFRISLNKAWEVSGKPKENFSIILKPAIVYSRSGINSALSVDPELISLLVQYIRAMEFTNITIQVDQKMEAAQFLSALANQKARVVETGEELVMHDFGSFLEYHEVDKAWHDADFRISFAKNRTSRINFYEGSISNIGFGSKLKAKKCHTNGRKIFSYEFSVLLADRIPVHFGFIDAWISADGKDGNRSIETNGLLGSANLLALDWVAGEKMNVNPAFNPVIQEAMHRWGTMTIIRMGNMTPWPGWKNPGAGMVALKNLFV
jgi:hypothetical protein